MGVKRSDGDGWDYACPACPFQSTRWRTKALADGRGAQHQAEHDGEGPMPELQDYRSNQGE